MYKIGVIAVTFLYMVYILSTFDVCLLFSSYLLHGWEIIVCLTKAILSFYSLLYISSLAKLFV